MQRQSNQLPATAPRSIQQQGGLWQGLLETAKLYVVAWRPPGVQPGAGGGCSEGAREKKRFKLPCLRLPPGPPPPALPPLPGDGRFLPLLLPAAAPLPALALGQALLPLPPPLPPLAVLLLLLA